MKTECVYSPVCRMWINNIHDNGGNHTLKCSMCEHYLRRKDVTQSLTRYTLSVRRFLEGESEA